MLQCVIITLDPLDYNQPEFHAWGRWFTFETASADRWIDFTRTIFPATGCQTLSAGRCWLLLPGSTTCARSKGYLESSAGNPEPQHCSETLLFMRPLQKVDGLVHDSLGNGAWCPAKIQSMQRESAGGAYPQRMRLGSSALAPAHSAL